MYKPNEVLITTTDIGREDSPKFLKKGSNVTFSKVANPDCSDLATSLLIVVREDGSLMIVKESDVRIRSLWRRLKAVREINEGMYKSFPRLRRGHHNPFKRVYFIIHYFILDLFNRKKVDNIDKVEWK